MSRRNSNHEASSALDRARQAAAQVKPAAAQIKPAAASAAAAARRRVHSARSWAAPQVDRTGQILQDSVAPRVSALLSSAARRLEPAKPKRRHGRDLAVSSALTAAATAVAAIVLNRRKPHVAPSADEADTDQVTPAEQKRDWQARTSTEADADGRARTS
jgi:hypothetical protein